MSKPARTLLSLLFSLSIMSIATAQTAPPDGQAAAPIVTATASSARVRYVSMGEVHQTRLQVFSMDGAQIFDSGLRLGNLIDWQLQDQQGLPLSAGTYLYLISVKEFSQRSTQKYGSAVLDQEQVYLEQTSIDSLSQAQATALEANRNAETLSAVDRIGVAAMNRPATTSPDGTTPIEGQPSGTESSEPVTDGENISGTGTQNYLSKWLDNAGTLGDSVLFESSGRIGLGTTTPGAKFHVIGAQGSIGGGTFQLDTPTLFSGFTGAYPAFEILNTNPTNNNVSLFQFSDAPSGAAHAGMGAVNTNHAMDFGDLFFFSKAAADGYQVRMGVYNGKVGVGTTSPTATLDVSNVGGGGTLLARNANVTGGAGAFLVTNSTNPSSAVVANNFGGGSAGAFGIFNTGNTSPALLSQTNSTTAGIAAEFINSNPASSSLGIRSRSGGGALADIHPGGTFLPAAGEFAGPSGVIGGASSTVPSGIGVTGVVGASGSSASVGVHGRNLGSGSAGTFQILNTSSSGTALEGRTNGLGKAGRFLIENASNSGNALESSTDGTGNAGKFQISNASSPGNALEGKTSGVGSAGFFEIQNAGNSENALRGVTTGSGFAASFVGVGTSSQGVFIQSSAGQKGLEIFKGRVILSYASVASGTIPSDVAVVGVSNDFAGTTPSVALPASAEDGTVIVVGTSDPHGAEITGATLGPHTITIGTTRRFTRIFSTWRTEN